MKKLICLTVFLLIAAPIGSADIFFQPEFSTINVGDTSVIDVMYSGAVAPWLGAYDINISYDPAIVPIFGVSWSDNFLTTSTIRDATFGAGTVEVAETSLASIGDLGAAQSGTDPFRLFRLMFSGALAPGISPLTFDSVLLSDGNGRELAPGNTPAGSITVRGGASVPEPAVGLLLLIPAWASFAIRRKRRQE